MTAEVIDAKDEVGPSSLPGGEAAVVHHEGPSSDLEPVGAPWEVHHGHPGSGTSGDGPVVEVVQAFREA